MSVQRVAASMGTCLFFPLFPLEIFSLSLAFYKRCDDLAWNLLIVWNLGIGLSCQFRK